MDALDHRGAGAKAMAGDGSHLGFDEETRLDAGVIRRHAIGGEDAFGQFSDLLDGSQHTDQISYRIGGPYGLCCARSTAKSSLSVGKFRLDVGGK